MRKASLAAERPQASPRAGPRGHPGGAPGGGSEPAPDLLHRSHQHRPVVGAEPFAAFSCVLWPQLLPCRPSGLVDRRQRML